MKESDRARALELAHEAGVLTAVEARRGGIHSQTLTRLVRDGELERVTRGCYRPAGAPVTEHHALARVAMAIPEGVVCLLSALDFHGIGTQVPRRVWLAVARRSREPTLEWPPLRVVRFGGEAMVVGVDVYEIEGVAVRVYSPAKTVADLFKYRNKVGVDVAVEALKEVLPSGRVTVDELLQYARVCRVERVIRPYIEAVVA
jgi:predicted transcriptional regulator of viral defense system